MLGRFRGSVILVLALTLVTACSSVPADEQATVAEEFFGYDQMTAEYWRTTEDLELPTGAAYQGPSGLDDGSSYQRGVGEVDATMEWNCAWGREWLAARGVDDARADLALERYSAFLETRAFQEFFDPASAQPVVRGVVEKAHLGDPSGVQQEVETNCPGGAE